MKNFFLLGLFFIGNLSFAETHICYFSLNNEKEFTEMEKFTTKLNQISEEKITVKEYLTPGGKPEEAFKKMIESGARCDGLVISGHHTGSWGGKRANGKLPLKFLENISCDPKYGPWFNKIHSVWLQGCRTLGVGEISATDTAEQHMNRVGEVLDEDHLEQSFSELNTEFSDTLDQDNPLSSRYLRIFPRSSVFGWTKTAPGEKVKSERSIPYHIAHMAKHMDDRGRYFEDPTGQMSKKTLKVYLDVLKGITKLDQELSDRCGYTDAAVKGWLSHGDIKNRYAYDNSDLQAYKSLSLSGSDELKLAKTLDCVLKNAKGEEAIFKAIDQIVANEKMLGFSLNSIWEVVQRYQKENNQEALKRILVKLKESDKIGEFLLKKIEDESIGVIRKIDYYAFYRDIYGNESSKIRKAINRVAQSFLMKVPKDYNPLILTREEAFKRALVDSLAKNGLFTKETLMALDSKFADKKYGIKKLLLRAFVDGRHFIPGGGEFVKSYYFSKDPNKRKLARYFMNYAHQTFDKGVLLKEFIKKESLLGEEKTQIFKYLKSDRGNPLHKKEILEKTLEKFISNEGELISLMKLMEGTKGDLSFVFRSPYFSQKSAAYLLNHPSYLQKVDRLDGVMSIMMAKGALDRNNVDKVLKLAHANNKAKHQFILKRALSLGPLTSRSKKEAVKILKNYNLAEKEKLLEQIGKKENTSFSLNILEKSIYPYQNAEALLTQIIQKEIKTKEAIQIAKVINSGKHPLNQEEIFSFLVREHKKKLSQSLEFKELLNESELNTKIKKKLLRKIKNN